MNYRKAIEILLTFLTGAILTGLVILFIISMALLMSVIFCILSLAVLIQYYITTTPCGVENETI